MSGAHYLPRNFFHAIGKVQVRPEIWMNCFPSPLPSPSGRGRTGFRFFPGRMATALITGLGVSASFGAYVPTNVVPPMVQREFRGAWVATLNNIDWPSKPGLKTADQKQELLRILDRAREIHLNAI